MEAWRETSEGAAAAEQLRSYLSDRLSELDDERNVHQVKDKLLGSRWTETVGLAALPEEVVVAVQAQVDRAWNALARYPWDLPGAQAALKAARERVGSEADPPPGEQS